MKSRFKTKPFAHQLAAYKRALPRECFALFMEQGTGKTKVVVDLAAEWWNAGDIEAMVVFAPNGVHDAWVIDAIPAHMPDWVRYESFVWGANMPKREEKRYRKLLEKTGDHLRIVTFNAETLGHKRGVEVVRDLLDRFPKVLVVVDESGMFANPATNRTKALLRLRSYSVKRIIMDGTPITENPFQVWAPMTFLDPTILGPSFYAFKAEHAMLENKNSWLVKHIQGKRQEQTGKKGPIPFVVKKDKAGKPLYRNLDKLQSTLKDHSYRILKQDCLDLPPKLYKRVFVELSDAQKAIYNQCIRDLRIEWNDNVSIVTKLSLLMRLQQIVGGFLPDKTPIFPAAEDNPRMVALMEALARQNPAAATIIWARFTPEIDAIAHLLRGRCVVYNGETSKKDRSAAVEAFRAGDVPYFVGNQKAGGVGLDLPVSSFMHFYSNEPSLRVRLQAEDRQHRIGSERHEHVTYIDYDAKGSNDRKLIDAFRGKREVADLVTGDIRKDDWLNEIE